MRMFFRLLMLVVIALAAVSIWVTSNKWQQGELPIQSLQEIPGAETVISTPVAPETPATPTQTPTPEPNGIDETIPQLISLSIAESELDTVASSQPITLIAHIVDDLSGVQWATLHFAPTDGGTQTFDLIMDAGMRVEGDRRDGMYQSAGTLPKYAAYSRWTLVSFELTDNANNVCQWSVDGLVDSSAILCDAPAAIPYFVNGEDSGPVPTPTPTLIPTATPDFAATMEAISGDVDASVAATVTSMAQAAKGDTQERTLLLPSLRD